MKKQTGYQENVGGVTAAKGFYASHTAAGIKYQGRADMALLYSERSCAAAGTFTQNVVKAAPVKWDRRIVKEEKSARAVVVNAGIANACTGEEGMNDCRKTAENAAKTLGISADEVLIASTGVIGMQLPIDRICSGIETMAPQLSGSREAGTLAARAIMTTDTHEKETAVRFELGDTQVTVGGMCKGSGMIHPNMCTMLSFITTDVDIDQALLQEALFLAVDETYNMISVDGDTSTNDTCLVLANGMAGNQKITEKDEAYEKFFSALLEVNRRLAKMMAGDGEGATALFEVTVEHAATREAARTLAKSVVTSTLTKAAVYGHDANWGRILCALGYAGVEFDPQRVDLYFMSKNGTLKIVENGIALAYDEKEATHILNSDAVTAVCDMKQGEESATAWGCDLTYEYVKINADYRS